MSAFATYTDLATRLNRVFTADEQTWVTALLDDAAEFMRGVMRNQVYPSTQSTYTAYPVRGRVHLPQSFIRSVDVVARDGVGITYTQFEDSVDVDGDDPVQITFTYGVNVPPGDLVGINCAIVSQQLLTVEAGLGLNAGGLSSIALDDFKAAFADAGASTGMAMTDATKAYLETNYGARVWFVNVRP